MAEISSREPRRRQKRGLKAEQKILEAAEALLREGGFDAAQISRIVEVSGVSNGSFYHHFGSKEAVVRRMIARYCDKAKSMFSGLELADLAYDEAIFRAVCTMICLFEENPELYRTMGARVKAEPDIWEPLRGLRGEFELKLLTEIGPMLSDRGIPDPELAISTMMQSVLAIGTHNILFSSGPIRLYDSHSRDQLVRIAKAVLELEKRS